MGEVMMVLVVGGGFAAILGGLAWLTRRARKGLGGAIGPVEEIFRPTAHRARFEIHVLQERKAPTAAPGDPPAGLKRT